MDEFWIILTTALAGVGVLAAIVASICPALVPLAVLGGLRHCRPPPRGRTGHGLLQPGRVGAGALTYAARPISLRDIAAKAGYDVNLTVFEGAGPEGPAPGTDGIAALGQEILNTAEAD